MCAAIISDIFVNLEVLAVVNRAGIKSRVDAYICLGDVVGVCDGPQLKQSRSPTTMRQWPEC